MPDQLSREDLLRAEACIPAPKAKKKGITAGALVYWLWHHPRLVIRDGVKSHFEAWIGERRFAEAIDRFVPADTDSAGQPIVVSLLAGRRHAPLAAVALTSLQQTARRPVHPVVHDDGTLGAVEKKRLESLFPKIRFVSSEETQEALDRVLPEKSFPFLRRTRLGYLNLRKLTDVHAHGKGWTLVMDSDVFFFHKPQQLLDAVDSTRWAHMVDCQTSYGCAVSLLEEIAGAPVHPRLNAGLMHMDSRDVDWDFLEFATRAIMAREGFSYYLEQALLGALMARKKAEALEASQYLVNPTDEQARQQREVAHHFVDRSILHLYRFGWQRVLRQSGNP
jgi:hypothetical protein